MLDALDGRVHDYAGDELHQAYVAACRRSAHYRALLGQIEEYDLIPHFLCHAFLRKHPDYARPGAELTAGGRA